VGTDLPLNAAADAIALVGLLALARLFISLAGMDVGTAFGTLGARREMLVGFLAEPALLMVLFTASLISHSTSLATIVQTLAHREFVIYPSMAFAAVAFWMISVAENARIPVDNPTTHLELTMIHEAMILEYSGKRLAIIEWGAANKYLLFIALGANLFFPWGVAHSLNTLELIGSLLLFILKCLLFCAAVALIESSIAKFRIFRLPDLLFTSFIISMIAIGLIL
jgi:formate hydrogenlyase subunit 4